MEPNVKPETEEKLIPVTVKNQKVPEFDGSRTSAGAGFEAIARGDTAGRVSRFEILVNLAAAMPPNFRVEPKTGRIWRLVSGTDTWVPWEFGDRGVFVKRAALGSITKD